MGNDRTPNPQNIHDLGDLIAALERLRINAGAVSYRRLADRVGPLLRPPRDVSWSTVADVFKTHRRRLDFDLVMAVLRALGIDQPELALWQAAYARAHQQPRSGGPAGVFRQLPADLSTFTGRAAAMKELIGVATAPAGDRPTTVVVSTIEGMGGVGKTQLAVHAAHELVRSGLFGDVQLYVDLRGFDPEQPPADPAEVLDGFLRALQVQAQHIPADLHGRAAMFRDRLHGKSAVVILDNAASEGQVRPLLPAGPGCLVLITSRRSLAGLDGAALHQLDVFSRAEAVDLLVRIVGVERVQREPDAADAIVLACGLLPLAVALAAARLRSRPAWSLAELVERLRAGGLDAVSAGGRSLRPVFDLSYRELDPESRRVFRLLNLHPGQDFTTLSAANLAGAGHVDTRAVLEHLLDEQLVQQKAQGRFSLHDLLKQYSADCRVAEEPPTDALMAQQRLFHWYLKAVDAANLVQASPDPPVSPADAPLVGCTPNFISYDQGLAWLDQEWRSLVEIVSTAFDNGWHDLAWRTAVSLKRYFRLRTQLTSWVRTHEVAIESTRILGDELARARVLNSLAGAHHELGDYPKAIGCGRQVVEIYQASGDQAGLLSGLINLSAGVRGARCFAEGIATAEEAETIARVLGDTRRIGLALSNKADNQSHSGDFAAAAASNLAALTFIREAGDRLAETVTLGALGDVYVGLREWYKALDCFRNALEIRRVLGHRRLEAGSLLDIGNVFAALNRREEAVEAWSQSLELFEECGDARAETVRANLTAHSRRQHPGGATEASGK